MAKLPVTVTELSYIGSNLYRVTVALEDGTTQSYVIPETIATLEGVKLSALVIAMLSDPNTTYVAGPGGRGRPHHAWTTT